MLEDDIGDHTAYTRFAALAPYTRLDRRHGVWRTALTFETHHKPGALHSAIAPLAERGIDMVQLVSRPIPCDALEVPLRLRARRAPSRRRSRRRAGRDARRDGTAARLRLLPRRPRRRRRHDSRRLSRHHTAVRIELCDVGPRDGLQNEPEVLGSAIRAELVERLASTGLPRIEVASFVRDDLVPQMAEAEAVVAALVPADGVTYSGLVLNARGYERLRATTLREVHVSFAASETFQQRNAGGSVEQGLADAMAIIATTHADGRRVSVTLSTAFGCPFEGHVDEGRVVGLLEQVVAAGADEVVVADTIGVAVPTQTRRLVEACIVPSVKPTGAHFHDTRNTAVACAWAAVEAGATDPGLVRRRHRRLPIRTALDGERRNRGSRVPA